MTSFKVNGQDFQTDAEVLSYEDVVELAELKSEYNPTVVFHCKLREKYHEMNGSLTHGQEVLVMSGMVFSVAYTGSA